MTISQLEAFRAVARLRHFGRAAERLGKSQPALSLQVQKLESEIGGALFERAARRIALTEAGELLLPRSERILAEIEEARREMDELRGGFRGLVRIGVLPTVAAHFFPPVLTRFQQVYPGVEVLLREERRSPDLLDVLIGGDVDLAVCLRQAAHPALEYIPLLTEEFLLAVSREHPLAGRKSVAVSRLREERFVVYKTVGHNTRENLMHACHTAGFKPRIAFESEQAETIQYLVASNLGVTFLPSMVLRHGSDKGIVPLRLTQPTLTRTIVVARRADRRLPKACRDLAELTVEAGREWAAG